MSNMGMPPKRAQTVEKKETANKTAAKKTKIKKSTATKKKKE